MSTHVLLFRNLLGENLTDKLDIKMNPDGSGQLYVPGLTEFTVQSPEDINKVSSAHTQPVSIVYLSVKASKASFWP